MEKYFRLNQFIRFVSEDNSACLYNLSSGEMISLDKKKNDILRKVEDNYNIMNLTEDEMNFLCDLNNMGLGKFYDEKVYLDSLYLGDTIEFEKTIEKNIEIKRLYIEITNKCNLDCLFCNYLDDHAYKKTGCKRWKNSGAALEIDKYKNIIDQAKLLGVEEIAFIGGEPFIELDKMKKIVEYAVLSGIVKFRIFTNLTLMDESIIEFINSYNVTLIIQLVSLEQSEFKKICNVNIENRFLQNIKLLNNMKVTYFIKLLINRYNEDSITSIINELEKYDAKNKIIIDYIYPHNNNHYSNKFLNSMFDKRNKLINTKLLDFSISNKYNKCFYGQISITLDGNVIPCVMLRNMKLGTVNQQELYEIVMSEKYLGLRSLTKDRIEKCNKCSYRYGCTDCRAIEMEASNNIHGLVYCK